MALGAPCSAATFAPVSRRGARPTEKPPKKGPAIPRAKQYGDVPGYVPEGGSSRRYRNVATGETISRRQYDNLRIQASTTPFKNRAQIEKYRSGRNLKAQRYRRIARHRDKMLPIPRGVKPEDYDSEFVRLYVAMENDPKNTSPTGPTAEFLTYIGLRDPSDQWDVGETP